MFSRYLKNPILFILAAFILAGFPSLSPAQGVQTFTNLGLYGGQIYDIAIDHSNPDKMFASSYLGDGLFVTTDGGSNWQAVETNGTVSGEDEFKNHANYAVKIAPSNSDVVWVAHNYWAEKSTDGGATWTHITNSTMQSGDLRLCMALSIDPNNPDVIFVGTGGPNGSYSSGAIYKTTDGGTSWSKMNQGNNFDSYIVDIDIDPNNTSVIWAVAISNSSGWGTLYRSEDGGDTWSVVFQVNGWFYDVEVKPNDSNSIFTANGWGIFRHYYDAGSWKYEWILSYVAANVRALAFDPQDPETLYAAWLYPISWGGDGTGKIGRSTDGGSNWDIYVADLQFITLAVHPTDSSTILGGELNLGVYKSVDSGQNWTSINTGVNAVIVYDVAIDPNDSTHLLVGANAGVYEKTGGGAWSRISDFQFSTAYSIEFHPTNSLIFYAGIEGYLAKTLDGGQNWTYSNVLSTGYNYPRDIAIDTTNTDTILIAVNGFGTYGKIYKSENGGSFFTEVLNGVNQSSEQYAFNVVEIDPSDNQHIFAGGGNYFTPKVVGDLWESTDGGSNWTRTSLQNVIVNALLINPQNPNIMYAGCGYSGGMGSSSEAPVYKSTDAGATWTASYNGIPGYPTSYNGVTDLEFHSQYKNIIYASTTRQGIYVSNQARSWQNLGTPDYDVFAIAISSLYAGTQGGMLQLSGTGIIAGSVTDALTLAGIDGATVFTDMGTTTISVNGEFIMVSPAGTYSVTAIADAHANKTVESRTVYGGSVTWVDISMQSGIPDPSVGPDPDQTFTSAGSKYCFIATAAYDSPLAEQVEILRKFRDTYLLPYPAGQELVAFYYSRGRPIAAYIDSRPWLKPLIRIILYPLVGLAWLMLSTTTLSKVIIGLCVLTGCIGAARIINRLSQNSFQPMTAQIKKRRLHR